MQAILPSSDGPVLKEVPKPTVGQSEVLVRVRANSLNRADLLTLKGGLHGAYGGIGFPMGLEWAGEVLEVGPADERVELVRVGRGDHEPNETAPQ